MLKEKVADELAASLSVFTNSIEEMKKSISTLDDLIHNLPTNNEEAGEVLKSVPVPKLTSVDVSIQTITTMVNRATQTTVTVPETTKASLATTSKTD